MLLPRSIRTRLLLIIIVAAALYLLGNGRVALWDRDEPWYAQTSRQMASGDDWVVPRLLDDIRTAKPIFIYWCQASAMLAFGDNAFAARFPSAVGMTLTLAVIGAALYQAIGPRRALWTVFVLASSGLTIAIAKMSITDAVLLLWVTIAHLCLFAIYARAQSAAQRPAMIVPIILWMAIALAGLTKGPVVLGVLLTSMVVLALLDALSGRRVMNRAGEDLSSGMGAPPLRWWKQTRPLMGLIIIVLICGPWLVMIHLREPRFLPTTLGHDVLTRMQQPLEGHSGPPGYYLLSIWGTFFPWSLLLPIALVHGWRRRALPQVRYALAMIIGPWLMFEAVQTKLVHYILPIFPALAFLTADMLVRASRRRVPALSARAFSIAAGAWGLLVIAVSSALWLAVRLFPHPPLAIAGAALMSVLGLIYGPVVWRSFAQRRPLHAAATMGAGMAGVVLILYTLYLPNAPYLRLSPRAAEVLRADGAAAEVTEPGELIMIDYTETSLAFYQGGTIRPRERDYLQRVPPGNWPRWIVLTDRVWDETPVELGEQLQIIEALRGFNIANGRTLDLLIARKRE